jgi:hypothetical protein
MILLGHPMGGDRVDGGFNVFLGPGVIHHMLSSVNAHYCQTLESGLTTLATTAILPAFLHLNHFILKISVLTSQEVVGFFFVFVPICISILFSLKICVWNS